MLNMDVNFTNKVVLVTGAGAGIGEATSLLFAKLGASLALVDRDGDNLRNVAVRCEKEKGVKPLTIVADLGTDEGVERTAKETIDHFGRLDVLVNNAGIGKRSGILNTDMATFDQLFTINVRGVYNLTRLLVPHLLKTKGNIVNLSSIAASAINVGHLPYGMTKAAIIHFTKLVALELAPQRVRVNAVSPGITESTIVRRMTGCNDEEYQAWLTRASSTIPMRQTCKGLDIARMIVHLASDNSRLVTGAIVPVDGGVQFGSITSVITEEKI